MESMSTWKHFVVGQTKGSAVIWNLGEVACQTQKSMPSSRKDIRVLLVSKHYCDFPLYTYRLLLIGQSLAVFTLLF